MYYSLTIRPAVLFQLRRTGLWWGKTYRFAVFLKTRSTMFYHHVTASSLDPTTFGTIGRSRLRRRPCETAEVGFTRRLFRSCRHCLGCRSSRIVRHGWYWRGCRYRVWSLTIYPYLQRTWLNHRRRRSCRSAAWLSCRGFFLLPLSCFLPLIAFVNPTRVARRANRSRSR